MGIHVDRLATLHLWSLFIRGRASKYFILSNLTLIISICICHLKATLSFFSRRYFIYHNFP